MAGTNYHHALFTDVPDKLLHEYTKLRRAQNVHIIEGYGKIHGKNLQSLAALLQGADRLEEYLHEECPETGRIKVQCPFCTVSDCMPRFAKEMGVPDLPLLPEAPPAQTEQQIHAGDHP